ncbi:glycan-binding surface protein [Paraflavitalea speifideaquila]|uniref:glycan-binding surface protein n=1 Tax=Paraflavitalea speifideaquila TaxID=3076558 RepID=UPI0028EC6739|nr:glycan-binding surface protein [Paraflavitalea speifideiaquila]
MRTYNCFVIVLLALVTGFTACEKDKDAKPVITRLRAISPSPNDSTLTLAGPGQTVVIQGRGLATTTQIFFNGYPTPFNSALLADDNIVVTIPADMPFASLDPAQLNTVKVITRNGEAVLGFPVVPPPAVLLSASNENGLAGERITIRGNNFFFVEKVIFPGGIAATANLATVASGTTIEVTVPAGIAQAGPLQVVTKSGTGSSVFLFNDYATGMISNFDNINTFSWGCTIKDDASLFPGNHGKYAHLQQDGITGNNWDWWNGKRGMMTNAKDWLPASELGNPAGNYAMKFDIYVKEPWTTGVLFIGPPPNDTWVYMYRYEPWKTQPGFKTNGWITVTVPLSEFRKKSASGTDGAGDQAAKVSDVIGGIDEIAKFMFVNDTGTPIAKLDMAIDNVRVYKIVK